MSAAFGLMLAVFVGIALLRGPIGLAMIAGGIAYLGATGQDMGLAAEQILNSLFGSFVLIAVPMFIFAANVMNSGTLSERLYALAHAIMGRFRGGLAHVNVLASVIFAGMSGSAIADAVGPGMVEIEMMCKNNRYSRPFAVAVSAASATIGPIIPPSIPMVLYALVSGASVGALFLGGVVPGLLMAAAMMLVIIRIARRRNFPMEVPVPWSEIPRIFVRTLLPLLMPVVLLGGIYSGVFTPTEAAAVAALYALALALFVYRALDWKGLVSVLADSARSTAAGRTRGGSGSRALRRRHRGEHDDRPAHSALRSAPLRPERPDRNAGEGNRARARALHPGAHRGALPHHLRALARSRAAEARRIYPLTQPRRFGERRTLVI